MEDLEAGDVLNSVIQSLGKLNAETRQRVLKAVISFYSIQLNADDHTAVGADRRSESTHGLNSPISSRPDFSSVINPTPKQFLMQKQPRTDVERMACLAYYLTHYRDTPHFKTLDLAKLNTEAAQPKLTNAAYAANNASYSGYLTSAPGGARQLSAVGEQFVQALPDREAAKSAMSRMRNKRPSKANRKKQK